MDMNSAFGTGRNFPVHCAHVFQLEILHVHALKITKPFKTNPKIAKLILLKAEGTSSLLFNGPRICHIISPMGNVYQSGFLLGTENCHNGKHNILGHNEEASKSHSPQLASIQVKSFRVILRLCQQSLSIENIYWPNFCTQRFPQNFIPPRYSPNESNSISSTSIHFAEKNQQKRGKSGKSEQKTNDNNENDYLSLSPEFVWREKA